MAGKCATPTEIRHQADKGRRGWIDLAMPRDNITSEVVIIDQDGHEMPFSPELLLPPGHATESCDAPRSWEGRLVPWT